MVRQYRVSVKCVKALGLATVRKGNDRLFVDVAFGKVTERWEL
jgi:hypothetical protein